jgi:hypothetical protein
MPTVVTLYISIFRMKTGTEGALQDYITAATQLLQRYNMRLDVHPPDRRPIEIDFVWQYDADSGQDAQDSDAVKIRQKASQAFDDRAAPARFPVIMWPMKQSGKGGIEYGCTQAELGNAAGQGRKTVNGATWLPYTVLNSSVRDYDGLAMLHEMGHGALCWHPGENPRDAQNVDRADATNLMWYPDSAHPRPPRSTINKKQMHAFANAYFAVPRLTF